MEEKDLKKSQHRLIVICCIFVFMVFLAYTIIWEINYFSKYDNFKKVECTVIEHVEVQGKTYDKYVFKTDDNEYVEKITPFESKYDINEKFYVYADENTDIEVIYNRDNRIILLPVITGLFGIATIGVVVLYLINYKKNKVRN